MPNFGMHDASDESTAQNHQQPKEVDIQRVEDIAVELSTDEKGKNQDAEVKRKRHGARNQHRHKHFVRWILKKFPHILDECTDDKDDVLSSSNVKNGGAGKPTPIHILDVAGGKGELSARLTLCHSLHVVMIDPRPADIESVYLNSVVPKLPTKWQDSIKHRVNQLPSFIQDEIEKRFSQLAIPFLLQPGPSFQDERLVELVKNASLIIGLHADSATEAIVDAALLYQKPFVVVPCCVFPNLFCERYITVPDAENEISTNVNDSTDSIRRISVRTYDQFCQYLMAKHSRFVMEILPFEGRNVAIWWDGKY